MNINPKCKLFWSFNINQSEVMSINPTDYKLTIFLKKFPNITIIGIGHSSISVKIVRCSFALNIYVYVSIFAILLLIWDIENKLLLWPCHLIFFLMAAAHSQCVLSRKYPKTKCLSFCHKICLNQ